MYVLDPAGRLACVHLDTGGRCGEGAMSSSHQQSAMESGGHEPTA
jgi:hypothetical protein